MEEDDVRDEIERRKQRAKDLKLRETIWRLHNSVLKHYLPPKPSKSRHSALPDVPKVHPALLYPDIKGSVRFSDQGTEFATGGTTYCVRCQDKSAPREGREYQGGVHDEALALIMTLKVDGEAVFTFHMTRVTTYGVEDISFTERMGEIVRFIEGPWVTEIPELLGKIKAHEIDTRNSWQPKQSTSGKLQAQKRQFGL